MKIKNLGKGLLAAACCLAAVTGTALASDKLTVFSTSDIHGSVIGWNYFKLLLETVERYIVVGVLCYTSPLAFLSTAIVWQSWQSTMWQYPRSSALWHILLSVAYISGAAAIKCAFAASSSTTSHGSGVNCSFISILHF